MIRFVSTLLGAALILTIAASATQAQGPYRNGASRGLRLQNSVRQYNQGRSYNAGPGISQFSRAHASHQQCTDGHCHGSHGQCADGHCHDESDFEILNRHQCSGPNCDDCEDSGETYDEPDYEGDVEPGF